MIYLCKHCGFRSYHQGEIPNPFCPECRLNKSEIAPISGEFKARIKSDADIERILQCCNPAWKRALKDCITLPGEEVAVNITVYFQLDRQDGRPTHFSLSLDEARELLELPEEKLHEFANATSVIEAFKHIGAMPIKASSCVITSSELKVDKIRENKNTPLAVIRAEFPDSLVYKMIKKRKFVPEQDTRGAENVLAAGIQGKALTAMRGIEGKLYGPKTKYLRTFKDILINLMIKLRRVANLYDSSTGPITKNHMVIDIRGLANWAKDAMDELDKVRDSRLGTELELTEKIFRWIDKRIADEAGIVTTSRSRMLNSLRAFIERQMKEE